MANGKFLIVWSDDRIPEVSGPPVSDLKNATNPALLLFLMLCASSKLRIFLRGVLAPIRSSLSHGCYVFPRRLRR